jgi:hypothetical protein
MQRAKARGWRKHDAGSREAAATSVWEGRAAFVLIPRAMRRTIQRRSSGIDGEMNRSDGNEIGS